jgi:hypothetical protein
MSLYTFVPRTIFVCMIAAVAILATCSGPRRGEPPLNASSEDLVEWEWRYNERVISAMLDGRWHEEGQLLSSFTFFERLTGIGIRGNFATFGIFPTPETGKDFEKVKEWYTKNRTSLCWDYESGTVKACGSQ